MNLTGDSQPDNGQFDVLAIVNPQVDSCASVPQGESRSPALVLANIPDCNSNIGIDLHLAAMKLWIARELFHILESALESAVEKFETEKLSDRKCYFELAIIARVLMATLDAFAAGGRNLHIIDQNIVQDAGLVCVLGHICSEILGRDPDKPRCLAYLLDLCTLVRIVHPIAECYWYSGANWMCDFQGHPLTRSTLLQFLSYVSGCSNEDEDL